MSHLTFDQLRAATVPRCDDVFVPLHDWSPTDWACALAGESGEACDAVKKLRRLDDGKNTAKDPQTHAHAINNIASELADTVIYADLLAARLGIDLGQAVIDKFNAVSDLRGSSIKLKPISAPLYQLAREYHLMAEAYDQAVCSRQRGGIAVPSNGLEQRRCSGHASLLQQHFRRRAAAAGATQERFDYVLTLVGREMREELASYYA
jgi:NTP pyrophosphatase (non-canonical NTP hydrolase)